ncbi:MAG: MmcB family DNA repair protein, partial [Alphaproteobacteria bacterium]|nr:MmcB family DNA repair protein [Alphaproteobacteria bacterium]
MDEPALAPEARLLARGVARWLDRQGWRTLTEFPLASGRRVDLIALDEAGRLLIVEIKTTAGDFR